jgi:hypothetical protein
VPHIKKKQKMLVKVLVGKMKERRAWKAARTDEWLILKFILKCVGWEDVD